MKYNNRNRPWSWRILNGGLTKNTGGGIFGSCRLTRRDRIHRSYGREPTHTTHTHTRTYDTTGKLVTNVKCAELREQTQTNDLHVRTYSEIRYIYIMKCNVYRKYCTICTVITAAAAIANREQRNHGNTGTRGY